MNAMSCRDSVFVTWGWLFGLLEVRAVLGSYLLQRDPGGPRHDGVERAPPAHHHVVAEGEDVILALQVGHYHLEDLQHAKLGVPGHAIGALPGVGNRPLRHVLVPY
uniref:Uncharacterized protein n=1 Tax=Oryza brachyantha TaxID=4533 RepID=J3L3I3_ORYBR